ncbi:MAG: polyprenyl diphosphate synthase [Bacteroidaceae bacterium]|nr:polyprenyl diphosphate synthase [Bacteroidaceae bacterium]
MTYKEQIDTNRLPQHIAIIMDGNGRWAQSRGLDRSQGHIKGTQTTRETIEWATRLGIRYITLYTFSIENWNRPEAEVSALMSLLFKNIEEKVFIDNKVRLRVIGDMSQLPAKVREKLQECMDHTAHFDRTTAVLALSYSSRWEITECARELARQAASGQLDPNEISQELISSRLNASFMPDPDLLIRTGGEIRLSNYLLWQSAYTELYFTDVFWPDFTEEEFCKAIVEYQRRQRRFGKTSAQIEGEEKAK